MIGTSLYIIGCSAKNATRVRLRRLRQPRYLVGAIVGAAYVYFSFFRRFGSSGSGSARRRQLRQSAAPPPAVMAMFAPVAGLGMMAAAAAAWIVPFTSSALDFSPAETHLLLPAPVSRRSLIAHRLLRSQLGILFGSAIAGLASPSLSGGWRLRIAFGAWLLMCALRLYFVGVTLTRARLGARSARARGVAWLPIAVFALAFAIVGVELWQTWSASPIEGAGDLVRRLALPAAAGASRVVLAPFVAMVAPLFAEWPQPYLSALAAAAAVCVGLVAWVLASDAGFDEVIEARTQRVEARPAQDAPSYRSRAGAWPLAPTGRPEAIFVWKAATQSVRAVDRRALIRMASILISMAIVATALGKGDGVAAAVCVFALVGAGIAILLGPQILRLDIREDLQHLAVLKTWPVDGGAVARGEILWPGLLLSAVAWAAIAIAAPLSGPIFRRTPLEDRIAVSAAAALLAPALVFAQYLIHNAIALVFPAWVQLGGQRARGLDAMGQRIITLGGALLVLALMALPAAVPGAIVWFVARPFVGVFAAVPAAAAASAALLAEVVVGTEVIGPLFDRADVTAIEQPAS